MYFDLYPNHECLLQGPIPAVTKRTAYNLFMHHTPSSGNNIGHNHTQSYSFSKDTQRVKSHISHQFGQFDISGPGTEEANMAGV